MINMLPVGWLVRQSEGHWGPSTDSDKIKRPLNHQRPMQTILYVPFGDDVPILDGHCSCSCAYGSRGRVNGDVSLVGKCVSCQKHLLKIGIWLGYPRNSDRLNAFLEHISIKSRQWKPELRIYVKNFSPTKFVSYPEPVDNWESQKKLSRTFPPSYPLFHRVLIRPFYFLLKLWITCETPGIKPFILHRILLITVFKYFYPHFLNILWIT